MLVKVNGQDRELPEGTSILGVIERYKLTPDKVAVELNRRLVRSEQYSRILQNGDELEIVTFVGGG